MKQFHKVTKFILKCNDYIIIYKKVDFSLKKILRNIIRTDWTFMGELSESSGLICINQQFGTNPAKILYYIKCLTKCNIV